MNLFSKVKTEIIKRVPMFLSYIPVLNKCKQFIWKIGCSSEISFWDNWMKTKGCEWPDDYKKRINFESELQDKIKRLIDVSEGSEINILDVGAGPLSNLGCCWEGKKLKITAVDPLADKYDALLEKHGIAPPVRTIRCDAEKLCGMFAKNSFDFVYAKNCIDHSYAPLTAIEQMLHVVRPGCCIYLQHALNEAQNEGYAGLHQWNFFEKDGCFFIGNRDESYDVTKKLEQIADVKCLVNNNMIIVKMYKK